jgi:hypothetical protein
MHGGHGERSLQKNSGQVKFITRTLHQDTNATTILALAGAVGSGNGPDEIHLNLITWQIVRKVNFWPNCEQNPPGIRVQGSSAMRRTAEVWAQNARRAVTDPSRKYQMLGRLGIDRKRDFTETADDFWSDIRVSERQARLAVILVLGVFVCSAFLLSTAALFAFAL